MSPPPRERAVARGRKHTEGRSRERAPAACMCALTAAALPVSGAMVRRCPITVQVRWERITVTPPVPHCLHAIYRSHSMMLRCCR